MADNVIKQINSNGTNYDIAAKYDSAENDITTTYATKTERLTGDTNTLNSAKSYADELISGLGAVLKFKGTKATEAEVKAITQADIGDVYIVTADSSEWVAKEKISGLAKASAWEKFGGTYVDSWRPIWVNGTQVIGSGSDSHELDFVSDLEDSRILINFASKTGPEDYNKLSFSIGNSNILQLRDGAQLKNLNGDTIVIDCGDAIWI